MGFYVRGMIIKYTNSNITLSIIVCILYNKIEIKCDGFNPFCQNVE